MPLAFATASGMRFLAKLGMTATLCLLLCSVPAHALDVRPASGGVISTDAPWSLRWFGPGDEADPNITSGSQTLTGLHSYANFTLGGSGTVNIGTSNPPEPIYLLVIVSPGTCTIAGTINGSAVGLNLGGTQADGAGGSGGGGGGAQSTNSGSAGGSGADPYNTSSIVAGGSAGGVGANGGTGNAQTAGEQNWIAQNISTWPRCFGTKGGAGGTGTSAGGTGGLGGGCVVLACATINFTGTINVSGGAGNAGASGANNSGGGGGGGGGVVILSARNYTNNSGTINTSGGSGGTAGGSGAGAGGTGGAGWSKTYTIQ